MGHVRGWAGTVVWVALAALVAAIGLVAGCGSDSSGGSGGTLSLVAYSTPREAYEEIVKAYQATPEGEGVDVQRSFGASGEQSRAVEAGLEADLVALSLEPDVTRLVDAGLVDAGWNADPHKGMVTDSVVVFAVRKGNPKGIRTWADLVKDGVEVITPNPFTSGGAQWNIMAAYGAQLEQGTSQTDGLRYLDQLFRHVPVQDKSAREALQTFLGGKGDVLLAYENEAITAQQEGESLDYVIPDETILVENPVAVTKDADQERAKAFRDFLLTPEAQDIFASKGYRPVVEESLATAEFPTPAKLFTIDDLGGWPEVREKYFDRSTGLVTRILQGQGISTE
jgi:sulfate transport system substrate-binding protein